MTDRTRTLTVYLDQEIRVDDAEHVINAIRMIRHVSHVETIVEGGPEHLAMQHAKLELRKKLLASVHEVLRLWDPL